MIARISDQPVEIQIRTALQHEWAQLSEKYSDTYDPALKYGGGAENLRGILDAASALVAAFESREQELATMDDGIAKWFFRREHEKVANTIAAPFRNFQRGIWDTQP